MIELKTFSQFNGIRHGFYNAKESALIQDIILMNQVHSADVCIIDCIPPEPLSVDALVTKTVGLKLGIKTADCAPVLFADPVNGVIGAAHAGWKGAFQGILESCVLAMITQGAELKNIFAGIGPHLQKRSFEISKSMLDLFPVTQHIFFETQNDKILFDFHAYILHRLNCMGLAGIDDVVVDTYTDPNYLSYRRDPKNPARQFSVISLDKGIAF